MPTLLLIRHGQASFGTDDYDRLSDLGIRQAGIAAGALALRRPNVATVTSGSLHRQIDTAAPAAQAFAITATVDSRWNEYSMDGILAAHHRPPPQVSVEHPGMSSVAFQAILEAALTKWMEAGEETAAPESWPTLNARVAAALQEAAGSLNSGETGLVYTSGGVIGVVCAQLLGLGPKGLILFNRVGVNTAVTKITVGASGMTLISFNDHSHLELGGTKLITYR